MDLTEFLGLSYVVIVLSYFGIMMFLYLQNELTELSWGMLIVFTVLMFIPLFNHAVAICYIFDQFVKSFETPVQKRK